MNKKVTVAIVLVIVLMLMIFGFNSCSTSNNKSNVKEDKVTTDKKETKIKENSDKTADKDKASKVSAVEDKSESTTLPNTGADKTTTDNTTTSKSNTSTSNTKPSNGGSSSTTKPATHTHNWVKKVIHHDAVTHTEKVLVSEAYDEPIYETRYADVCNTCGADITSDPVGHLFATEHDSYRTDVPITTLVGYNHHEAVYETKTIVDKAAYDEVIYTCSFGATK